MALPLGQRSTRFHAAGALILHVSCLSRHSTHHPAGCRPGQGCELCLLLQLQWSFWQATLTPVFRAAGVGSLHGVILCACDGAGVQADMPWLVCCLWWAEPGSNQQCYRRLGLSSLISRVTIRMHYNIMLSMHCCCTADKCCPRDGTSSDTCCSRIAHLEPLAFMCCRTPHSASELEGTANHTSTAFACQCYSISNPP